MFWEKKKWAVAKTQIEHHKRVGIGAGTLDLGVCYAASQQELKTRKGCEIGFPKKQEA